MTPAESPFPLRPGVDGPLVRDLHRRLGELGHLHPDSDAESFDERTALLVATFQDDHGLEPSGMCDKATWAALVESGYRIGDRFLYLHIPMLRGDDITQLQLAISALGFDAGRADGIFGPDTRRALAEFQRNVGLPSDGVAGPDVSAALERLGRNPDRATPVSTVRERERLDRRVPLLQSSKVIIGEEGSLSALTLAIARHLRDIGVRVVTVQHPDPAHHARQANDFEADLYLGLQLDTTERCIGRYFEVEEFQSIGGRQLAEQCAQHLAPLLEEKPSIKGMRLPVLRLTRMPAVSLRLGPPRTIVRRTPELSKALTDGVIEWLSTPVRTP
ncbi:MAG: peptidoglycan-binding protein [Acidobacteria bacterium]|nr:peptidoglycan-binding protein [Acidobacteriota bacterium]